MLKHFCLGRRSSFPAILSLRRRGCAVQGLLYANSISTFWQPKSAFELLVVIVGAAGAFVYFLYSQHHQDMLMFTLYASSTSLLLLALPWRR